MVAGEFTLKPGVSAKYGCSAEVIEVRSALLHLRLVMQARHSPTVQMTGILMQLCKFFEAAIYLCFNVQAVESMEVDRERLYFLQLDADVEASLMVDLRLSGQQSLMHFLPS